MNFVIFDDEIVNLDTIVTINKYTDRVKVGSTGEYRVWYTVCLNNGYTKKFMKEEDRDAFYDKIIDEYNAYKEAEKT